MLSDDIVSLVLFSGPWFIGEVIDGHSGACFAFGVFVDGHFLEGSLTYVVGFLQVRKACRPFSCLSCVIQYDKVD